MCRDVAAGAEVSELIYRVADGRQRYRYGNTLRDLWGRASWGLHRLPGGVWGRLRGRPPRHQPMSVLWDHDGVSEVVIAMCRDCRFTYVSSRLHAFVDLARAAGYKLVAGWGAAK